MRLMTSSTSRIVRCVGTRIAELTCIMADDLLSTHGAAMQCSHTCVHRQQLAHISKTAVLRAGAPVTISLRDRPCRAQRFSSSAVIARPSRPQTPTFGTRCSSGLEVNAKTSRNWICRRFPVALTATSSLTMAHMRRCAVPLQLWRASAACSNFPAGQCMLWRTAAAVSQNVAAFLGVSAECCNAFKSRACCPCFAQL
jgi:hypothetical protein